MTWHDCSQSAAVSSTEHLLDHVARHAVEEERDEDDQQQEDDHFEEQPAIVVPEYVSDRLERVEEPDERRVRPATFNSHIDTQLCYIVTTTQQFESMHKGSRQ